MVLVTTGDPDESGQLAQRQIEGVYTLDEAVNTLCQNVEVLDRAQKLADLKMLVENGKVKVNRFGTLDLTPTPLKARTFHEVAHWEDLNQNWLSKYQFIDWRFPDPLERLKPDWVIPSEFRALARLGEALIQQGSKGKKGRPQSLPEDEVARLIQMRKDKPTLSQDSLADEFKVTRGTIRNILKKYGKN